MTREDEVLRFLSSRPGEWFDDDQLSGLLGIYPRQQVNHICNRLAEVARIRRESRGGKLCNSAMASLPLSSPGTSPTHPLRPAPPTDVTPIAFEARAAEAMSKHFGVPLGPDRLPGVPKLFDLVSPDKSIVGDAKYYTLVRGTALPPAKFSVIAEHVWLLEKTKARHRFLVFGNERRVSEEWLRRYGELVDRVAFYFLDDRRHLDQIR